MGKVLDGGHVFQQGWEDGFFLTLETLGSSATRFYFHQQPISVAC